VQTTSTTQDAAAPAVNCPVGDHPAGLIGTALARLHRRRCPLVLSTLMLAVGFLYLFFWDPLVNHVHGWDTGGDMWGIFRGAHYVGWGYLGGVYDPSTGIVTFPGMAVLLAPVAMLSGKLHLTETFFPFVLARPTAALLLQPIEVLLAATVVFATDAMAECLDLPKVRRIALCTLVAVLAWPLAAVWGHAEDALALTFAIYALLAMLRGRWSRCGWLLGLGIVMQPLVALLLPLFLGATPAGKRAVLAVRSLVLSAVLVGMAYAENSSGTFRAVVRQPTPPSVNHATPWISLAPVVAHTAARSGHYAVIIPGLGHPAVTRVATIFQAQSLVSGGIGRSIDVLLAVLVGIFVWRRPQHPVRLMWLAAFVLASRCFFEAVMTSYYIAPPLILALALVARQRGWRFWGAGALSLGVTVFAYYRFSPWAWWLPIVAVMTAIVALGYPDDLRTAPETSGSAADSAVDAWPDADAGGSPRPEPERSVEPALR
jgi:hypothetical protein